MKNKKILMVIALIVIIILAIVLVWFLVFNKKNSNINTQANQNTNTKIDTKSNGNTQSNFVKCDIDNRKGVVFKIISVKYTEKPYTTMFMAQEQNAPNNQVPILQFDFPGKTTIDYAMKIDDGQNVSIHYGTGQVDKSWGTNADNGDTYKIKVTKFSGTNIEGSFSGETTNITPKGWNLGDKMNFKNCSFSSNLEVKPL